MRNTTSLRRLGVVLAALAIAGLAVGCAPETPGEPPDPCATSTASSGATANMTSTCPTPCPTASLSAPGANNSGCPTPCPTASLSAPGANVGGTCPTTPTTPPQPCDASTLSGGDGVTTTSHGLGVPGPTSFLFEYNAQSQPDRFQIFYEGVEILDTGWRGSAGSWTGPDGNPITIAGPGAGSATVMVPAGTATSVSVVVTGQGPGTVWGYEVNCPAPPV